MIKYYKVDRNILLPLAVLTFGIGLTSSMHLTYKFLPNIFIYSFHY